MSLIKIGLLVLTSAYINGTSILIHSDLCISIEQKGVVFCVLSLPKPVSELGLTFNTITMKVNKSILNPCENNYFFLVVVPVKCPYL